MAVVSIGKICVYAHSVNGVVVYVGKGMSQRPYEIRSRTKRWKAVIGEVFEVEILGWFDSDSEARAFEKSKIMQLRPAGNYIHALEPRATKTVRTGGWGGSRSGSGRPPLTSDRCFCGKHTLARALRLRLRCSREVKL